MNICIFGASSTAIAKSYIHPVEELGLKLAAHGHHLVFGAGANGLMGAAARGVHKGGGKIIGVVPSFFNVDGVLFDQCDEMIFTETMRERKQIMEDRADAFVITPGGPGTLDEFLEVLSLKQLGRHNKPIAVLNIHGFYNDLKAQFISSADKLFMTYDCMKLFAFFDDVDKLLHYLEFYDDSALQPTQLRFLESNQK